MKNKLKFLFPIPSIILLFLGGLFFSFSQIDNRSIAFKEWIVFMTIFFSMIIIPADIIIFLISKYKKCHQTTTDNKIDRANTQMESINGFYEEDCSLTHGKNSGTSSQININDTYNAGKIENSDTSNTTNNFNEMKDQENPVFEKTLSTSEEIHKQKIQSSDPDICHSATLKNIEQADYLKKIIKYSKSQLDTAERLSNIVNTTVDKREFFICLNKINQILYDLVKYEDIVPFGTPPSAMLKDISASRNKAIELLEKRISMKNFDVEAYVRECNELLEQKEPPSCNYDLMEGHEFEFFCAELLKRNEFVDVQVTKGSGDHGIDILAEKDGITYAIQCKCYSSNIGNAAVQQAHTGKSIYRKDIAIVLTNRYFTQQAIEEAAALGVKLWDRDKLNELIKKANKQ